MESYSVLLSIYERENSEYFIQSVNSLLAQTIPPEEIVIVCDGPINEKLEENLENFYRSSPQLFTIVRLEKNQGLGVALAKGVQVARNELIGRMDADDMALPNRFEKQLDFFAQNPTYSINGGQIEEFEGTPENITGRRQVPCSTEEIYAFSKKRNPFNHMTVMYKKSVIIQIGNYQPMPGFEDYYLWIRAILAGEKLANLSDILVICRAGEEMIDRRGGKEYAKRCKAFLLNVYNLGFYTKLEYRKNWLARITVARMPNKLRLFFYTHFLRKDGD